MLYADVIEVGIKNKIVSRYTPKFPIVEELVVLDGLVEKKTIANCLKCSVVTLNGYLIGIKKVPFRRVAIIKRLLKHVVEQSDNILRNYDGYSWESHKFYQLISDAKVLLTRNNEYRELMTDSDKRLAAISDEFEEFIR